jgi:hypothetical protein
MVDRLINATDVLNTALNTYPSTMLTTNTALQNVTAFAADCAAASAAGKPLWIKPGTYPFGTSTTTVIDLFGTAGLEIIGNGAVLQAPTGLSTSSIVRFTTQAGWVDYTVSSFTWSKTTYGTNPNTMSTVGESSNVILSAGPASWTRGEMVSIYSSDPIAYGYGDGVIGANQWELNFQHEMSQVLYNTSTTDILLANKTRRNFPVTGANKITKMRKYNNLGIKLVIGGLVIDTISDTYSTGVAAANRPKWFFEIMGFYAPVVSNTCVTKSVWQGDYMFAYTINAEYAANVIKAPNKLSNGGVALGYCPSFHGPNLKPRIRTRVTETARHATTTWAEAAASIVNGAVAVVKSGGNTGAGTYEGSGVATVGTPQVGVYQIRFTSATAFNVNDPSAALVGTGTVNTTFNNQIKFMIKPVTATPFVAGDGFDVTVSAHTLLGATTTLAHSLVGGSPTGAPTPSAGDLLIFSGISGTLGTGLNGTTQVVTGYTSSTVSFAYASTGQTGFGGQILHFAATSIFPAGGIHYGETDGLTNIEGGVSLFPSGAMDDEHENAIGSVFRNRSFMHAAAMSYEDTNHRPINNRGANALYTDYDITGFAQVAQFHSFSQNHGVENYIVCRNFNIRNESNRAGAGAMFLNFAGDANVLTDKRKLILDGGTMSGGYLVFFQNPLNGPDTLIRNWTFAGDWGDQAAPTKSIFMLDAGNLIVENCEFDFTDVVTANVQRLATLGSDGPANIMFRNCHFKNMRGSSKSCITLASNGCTVSIDNCTITYDPNAANGSVGTFIDTGTSLTGHTINIRGLTVRNVAKLDTTKSIINRATGSTITVGFRENITADGTLNIYGSGTGTGTLTATTVAT